MIRSRLGVTKNLLDEQRVPSDSLHGSEEEGRKIHASNFLTKRLDEEKGEETPKGQRLEKGNEWKNAKRTMS